VRVHHTELARHPEAIETTIYFCCVEALQNAGKHAGPEARIDVRLLQQNGHVLFEVSDDGAGFDPAAPRRGTGLTNLADRVAAVGGTLDVESAPGGGTRVTGRIPSA
jgi:signal transduction histidine kinase